MTEIATCMGEVAFDATDEDVHDAVRGQAMYLLSEPFVKTLRYCPEKVEVVSWIGEDNKARRCVMVEFEVVGVPVLRTLYNVFSAIRFFVSLPWILLSR